MNRFDYFETDNKLRIVIYSRVSVFVKIILGILVLFSIIGFFGVIFKLTTGESMKPTNIGISFAVFTLILIFTGRLFLWNSFGKEILTFDNGNFSFQYDYKLYKSELEQRDYENVVARVNSDQIDSHEINNVIDDNLINNNWSEGKLELVLKKENYISQIKLSKDDLINIINTINDFNKNKKL